MNTLAEAWLGQNGLVRLDDATDQCRLARPRRGQFSRGTAARRRTADASGCAEELGHLPGAVSRRHRCRSIGGHSGCRRRTVFGVSPALRSLGYGELTGINLTFGAAAKINGITFQHGDITQTGLAPQSYAFISCLSVIRTRGRCRSLPEGNRHACYARKAACSSASIMGHSVDAHGQQASGGPIRIFTRQDIGDMLPAPRNTACSLRAMRISNARTAWSTGNASIFATPLRICCSAGAPTGCGQLADHAGTASPIAASRAPHAAARCANVTASAVRCARSRSPA